MAHYAELDKNNNVVRVIVVDNNDCKDSQGVESEEVGAAFCQNLLGGIWKKTSYNNSIRKNYAGPGYKYNEELDAFIPLKPFSKWILNEETCQWESPIPLPEGSSMYAWNDEKGEWEELTPST